MNVVLHSIRGMTNGILELSVAIGNHAPEEYRAVFDPAAPTFQGCSIDDKLFMRLSDLAIERYGDCTVYHIELLRIVKAYLAGEAIPALPAELGTTSFCKQPSEH